MIEPIFQMMFSGNHRPEYSEYMKLGGVYMLSGVYPSSYLEFPYYIGGAINFYSRMTSHFSKLRNDNHPNNALQYYFNKHGADCLVGFVLEFTTQDRNIVQVKEQEYLDYYQPFIRQKRGFNASPNAIFDFTEEGKAQAIDKNSVEFAFISPQLEVIKGRNIKEFCRAKGLSSQTMSIVNKNGNEKSCHGWIKCPDKYLNESQVSKQEYDEIFRNSYKIHKNSKEDRDIVLKLHIDGKSKKEISAQTGFDVQRIVNILSPYLYGKKKILLENAS